MMLSPIVASVFADAGLSPAALAQASDWSGPYLGLGAGYSFKADDEFVVFDTDRDDGFDDTVRTSAGADIFSPGFCNGAAIGPSPANGCRTGHGSITLSMRAGYDLQLGNWVIGGVADHGAVNLGDDVTAFSSTPASHTFTRDLSSLTSLRARGG